MVPVLRQLRTRSLKSSGILRAISFSATQLVETPLDVFLRRRGVSLELGQKIMEAPSPEDNDLVKMERFRIQARMLSSERRKLAQLASSAYRKRSSEVASDISMEMKKRKKIIDELDTKAARISFFRNNYLRAGRPNETFVDLHGLCAHEALSVLHAIISESTGAELNVVVGKGSVLPLQVSDYCQLHGHKWRVDPDNTGAIQIEAVKKAASASLRK